jgi:hypothetical protein
MTRISKARLSAGVTQICLAEATPAAAVIAPIAHANNKDFRNERRTFGLLRTEQSPLRIPNLNAGIALTQWFRAQFLIQTEKRRDPNRISPP